MTLKPLEKEKTITYEVRNTKLSKNKGFESSLSFLAKYVNNSNHAIRLKDKTSGKVVAKIGYSCEGLKRPDIIHDIDSTLVDYTVEIAFKKKKARVEVTMTGFSKNMGQYGISQMIIAKADGQEEAVQKCNNFLISEVFKGIVHENSKSNW
jgi:hypothetical protein